MPVHSPTGGKVETKSKLMRQVGDAVDLTKFDYQSGRHQMLTNSPQTTQFQRQTMRRTLTESSPSSTLSSSSPIPSSSSSSNSMKHQFDYR